MNRRTHEEIQRVLDGELDAEEFAEFQQRMRDEPAVLELYQDYARLHHSLSQAKDELLHGPADGPEGKRGFFPRFLLALAVCGPIVFFGLKWLAGGKPGADVSFSKDAVWSFRGNAVSRDGHARLAEQDALDLPMGQAVLDFGRRGSVLLDAPAAGKPGDFLSSAKPGKKAMVRSFSALPGVWTDWDWKTAQGKPAISRGMVDGENFAMQLSLPRFLPARENGVLLVTVETGDSAFGSFHAQGGWSGISLFSGEREKLFFGDAYGSPDTWALDVKQALPVINPESDLQGARTITLRYDRKTGGVSLHEGGFPLKPPFCRGVLPDKPAFDGLRIAASSGSALRVNRLSIRESDE